MDFIYHIFIPLAWPDPVSRLHGMITLENSGVAAYVTDTPKRIYRTIIDEFLAAL